MVIQVPADPQSWADDMYVEVYDDGTIAVGPVHPDMPLSVGEATRLADAIREATRAAVALRN